MKYIAFTEVSMEEWAKCSEAAKKIWAEREKVPDKYPTKIFPDQMLYGDLPTIKEGVKVFSLYETNDPKQLAAVEAFWAAQGLKTMKRWYIPITDGSEFVDLSDTMKE